MQRRALAVVLLTVVAAGEAPAAATVRDAAKRVVELQARVKALEAGAHLKRIEPVLNPVSDSKFFDGHRADYPTDTRPSVPDHFNFPYPAVQDDNKYDKDYVTDENGDDGYWAAEDHYSKLRASMTEIKDNVVKAKAKATALKKAAEEAERKAKDAQGQVGSAEEEEKKALQREKDADKNATDMNATIDSAEDTVEKEVDDLEECKKQLAEARKKLKELVSAAEAKEAEIAAAEAAKAKSEAELANAEKDQQDLEARVAEERGELEAEKRTYEEELAHEKDLAAKLDAAAKKLRSTRAKQRGGQGFYSSAPQVGLSAICLGLSVLFATA